jgi:hypothetical protein
MEDSFRPPKSDGGTCFHPDALKGPGPVARQGMYRLHFQLGTRDLVRFPKSDKVAGHPST